MMFATEEVNAIKEVILKLKNEVRLDKLGTSEKAVNIKSRESDQQIGWSKSQFKVEKICRCLKSIENR